MENYNIGLDIGTTSVGWAVVNDATNKVMRKGGKALWGVRLFDSAVTAEDRRAKRGTRRRYDRRRERIKLLQDEFKDEINKVDNTFFKKLKESKYTSKDIKNKTVLIGNYWLINSGVDNRGSSVQFNYNVYIKEEYTTKLDVKPVFTISKY